jgi:hypothetical protein
VGMPCHDFKGIISDNIILGILSICVLIDENTNYRTNAAVLRVSFNFILKVIRHIP